MPTYEFLCREMPQDVRCRLVARGIQQTHQRKAQVPGLRQYQSGQNTVFGSSKNIKKELKTPCLEEICQMATHI